MTNKRDQYIQEFKLEAISLVVDHQRKILDVANSLGIGRSTVQSHIAYLNVDCFVLNGLEMLQNLRLLEPVVGYWSLHGHDCSK